MRTIGKDTILDLQMDWMDDRPLREKAREAIQNGKLPTRSPDRIMGGPGCGEACALCGETLQRNRMELEAEFSCGGEIHELHKYHLHPSCFAAWELECANSGESAVDPASKTSTGVDEVREA